VRLSWSVLCRDFLGAHLVSWSAVYACSSSNPDAACDGDGAVLAINSAELNASSWIQVAPSGGGTVVFVPAFGIPTGYVVKCISGPAMSGPCSGDTGATGFVVPSDLTFGLAAPYTPPFDVSQLDTITMTQAFSAGFILIAMAFSLGKAVSVLLEMVSGEKNS
jgi:hypothetical protein